MEQALYERPREKLRSRGVQSLSMSELLQIILGSGSKHISSAKIARSVSRLLELNRELAYIELVGVGGVGQAKACQILAAIELGRRMHSVRNASISFRHAFRSIASAKARIIEYVTLNGNDETIHERSIDARDAATAIRSIRALYAQALQDGAHSLVMGVGCRDQKLDVLDEATLSVIKNLFETADLLQIRLTEIWLVNQSTERPFYRKTIQ